MTIRRVLASVAGVAMFAGALGAPATRASTHDPFVGCEQPDSGAPVVGTVACRTIDASATLGGTTAYGYYVPPGCSTPGARCPVAYLLHGFGGDYTSMLGVPGSGGSAYVQALTRTPPSDPRAPLARPWNEADPSTWVEANALDAVLIAPHGRTLDGGFGPADGIDGFWTDWNPKYAAGGADEVYSTPPPRFETFLIDSLIPAVEAAFPVEPGRAHRVLAGVSLGGYGAFVNALRRPDIWAAVDSVSGAHNFLFLPGADPAPITAPAGLQPPARLGAITVPGTATRVPVAQLPEQARGFSAALFALGDPTVDQAYFRGHMPRDLAMNGRAYASSAHTGQSLAIRSFVNDSVPRRPEDVTVLPGYLVAQAFESIVLEMNVTQQAAFRSQQVANEFEIHPGIHSGTYWNAFVRSELEWLLAHTGARAAPPAVQFDYRTTDADFSVWSWHLTVERPSVEFLELRDVSCDRLTLRGTGVVTVTVPDHCHTGNNGERAFTVDLGPSAPVDEPAGAGAAPLTGGRTTVSLTPLT